MPRFHHLWIVEAELEIRNPANDAQGRCERLFSALERYASDDTEPYPAQVSSTDDGWLEVTFPTWAPSRFAAVAAGATILSEACALADIEPGVVRLSAGESSEELTRYEQRVKSMDPA